MLQGLANRNKAKAPIKRLTAGRIKDLLPLTPKKSQPLFDPDEDDEPVNMNPPSDEEDDELTEEPPAPNATDQEKIEWKRRQNTLAARRSRKRKLLYTQQLEGTVEKLTMEKEVWKTRTMTLKHLLHSNGIPCPDFKD